jgi:hypothetical protein
MFLQRTFQLPELLPITVGDVSFPVVWSIIGAALFVAVLSLLTWRRPEV